MKRLGVWLAAVATAFVMADLYLAFIWSPPEQYMGDLVRIMYFHVASAWVAFLAFFVTFVCSVLYLVRRRLLFDQIAVSSAEISLVYTSITLVSGSLWARPIWNVWWTWDPRLTTTLILWFLIVGLLLLRGTIAGQERRARFAAVYAIVAFVDVPIIHLSVTLWRSIHPNAVNDTGFNMPPSMAATLMFSFVTFLLLYAVILYLRVHVERAQHRVAQLRLWSREAAVVDDEGVEHR